MSIASGADVCIRKASSYEWMRAASSVSCGNCEACFSFRSCSRRSHLRCSLSLRSAGGLRSTIGLPVSRICMP